MIMEKLFVTILIISITVCSCTSGNKICNIDFLTYNNLVYGSYIVTQSDFDKAKELELKLRTISLDTESSPNIDEQLKITNSLLELDPYNDYAYIQRSLLHYHNGDLVKSYSDFRIVNLLYPQNQHYYLELVEIYNTSDFNIVKHQLETCIQDNPNDPYYLFEMGVYYYTIGNLEKAKKYFEDSLVLDSSQFSCYYMLANINFNLGQLDIAYNQISTAVELVDGNPLAYEFKAKIERLTGNHDDEKISYKSMLDTCNHPNVCFRALYNVNK